MSEDIYAPVVVVGSGIAGLTFALRAADYADVLLITKKDRAESSTNWARGGIAAVMGPDDDVELHLRDTLVAGAGLCHREVAASVVGEGPARIRDLMAWGAQFQREGGGLSLGREGGHSRRRIVHAGDHTGASIESALLQAVEERPEIRVVEDLMVVDLHLEEGPDGPRCAGITAVQRPSGRLHTIRAGAVLLATGGAGQAYQHTTNPSIATGDGVAMAFRAGARVANMEFIQFHPTVLYPSEDPAFLISEAVRGEGAVLRTLDGRAFMDGRHPLGSLAPRDVVAREIHHVLRATGDPHVTLDVSSIPRETFARRFPSALQGCELRGVDPWERGIPVVPAAHYQCGGIWTDSQARTSLPGLFAAGEVACTGLHGANRLASNSLLEAVVYSARAAGEVEAYLERAGALGASASGGAWEDDRQSVPEEEADEVAAARGEVRRRLWQAAGIERARAELAAAADEFTVLVRSEEAAFATRDQVSTAEVELRNLHWVAWMIAHSAVSRSESRGLHYLVDVPYRNNQTGLRDTVLGAVDRDALLGTVGEASP